MLNGAFETLEDKAHGLDKKRRSNALAAGKAGGEYLESINTTDLAKLNKDQWLAFLRSVVGQMAQERASVDRNDEIPF